MLNIMMWLKLHLPKPVSTVCLAQADKGSCWGQVRESYEDDRTGGAKIKTGLWGGMPQSGCHILYPQWTAVERYRIFKLVDCDWESNLRLKLYVQQLIHMCKRWTLFQWFIKAVIHEERHSFDLVVFAARCYASTALAVMRCLSVRYFCQNE